MSDGHDKASFYQGIRAAISWLHAEARGMNDPHAKLVLNNAAFHLGQRKPDPALLPPAPDGATEGWQVQWLIRQAKDDRLTPEERLSIIANFPQSAPSVSPVGPKGEEDFQSRVHPWMLECFGPTIPFDKVERGDLEEVFELLQSSGYDPSRVVSLRDYVWGREVGEPDQEVGGVMVTLAAYCIAFGLNMHEAGETELARIWTKVEAIRAKQAAKPTGSALPIAPSQPTQTGEENAGLVENLDAAILRINHLTGYSEDAVWRPADQARKAMIAARDALASRSPIPGEPKPQWQLLAETGNYPAAASALLRLITP